MLGYSYLEYLFHLNNSSDDLIVPGLVLLVVVLTVGVGTVGPGLLEYAGRVSPGVVVGVAVVSGSER